LKHFPSSIYIRSTRRTPLGAVGGIHKRRKTIDLVSAIILDVIKSTPLDALILGMSHGEGLSGCFIRRLREICGLPATLEAILLLEGESAGFRALELCARSMEMGASNTLALAAASISNMPYLLPDARRGRRMGSSSALDPMLLGDIPMPINNYADRDEWLKNTLLKTHKKHESGGFKTEIHEDAGDEFLEDYSKRLSAPNLSQLVPVDWQMAPLAEGACGVLLEKQPSDQTLARILSIQITPDSDGDGQNTLRALHETSGFDPLQADRIDVVDPCASHPLHFMDRIKVVSLKDTGLKDGSGMSDRMEGVEISGMDGGAALVSKINPAGGTLAMGYIPGAAGLRALTTLIHGLKPDQTGLCFQFGNGWSAGVLLRA